MAVNIKFESNEEYEKFRERVNKEESVDYINGNSIYYQEEISLSDDAIKDYGAL
jgi:hypothetical protein